MSSQNNRVEYVSWIDFGTEFGGQFCQLGLAGLQISCTQPVFRKEFSGTCPFQVMSSQGHVPDGRPVQVQEELVYPSYKEGSALE